MQKIIFLFSVMLLISNLTFSQDGPAVYYGMEEGSWDIDPVWYHSVIETKNAWGITRGSDDVVIVYLCRSGINWEHEKIRTDYDNINRTDGGEEPWTTWNGFVGNGIDDDGNGVIDDWRGLKKIIFPPSSTNNTLHTIYDPDHIDGTWLAGIISGINENVTFTDDFYSVAGGVNQRGIAVVPFSYSSLPDGSHAGLWNAALQYAIDIEADIFLYDFCTLVTSSMELKLEEARNAGIFIVAPSGWDIVNINQVYDPAGFTFPWSFNFPYPESVFSVGGSTKPDIDGIEYRHPLAHYSQNPVEDGDYLDLVAPAEKIYTTSAAINGADDEYKFIQGNAASAAMVAATAGLMLSVNPDLSTLEIRDILRETADKINNQDNGGDYNYNWNWDYPGHSRECGYGRLNTYRAVCAALATAPPLEVIDNDTWSEPKFSLNTITIPEDYTLTITSTVNMGPDAKIIVERGATLILDGGTLTNYKFCGYENELWQGVEVWGDASKSQYPCQGNLDQGTIEIKNGGVIENAIRGVLLSKYDGENYDEDYNGGIIKVLNGGDPITPDANFINNQRSVVFRSYENHTVNQLTCAEGSPTSNLSSLSNCHFEINSDYLGGGSFMSHIYMWEVRGINIRGCTFINDYSNNPGGHGINAWGAGFKVEAICNSPQSPCPIQDMDRCTFINFAKAVNNNSSGTRTVSVKDAVFTDNTRGVVLTNVHNASVLFSQFNIGKTQQSEEEECEGESQKAAAYGIDIEGCTGFAIEENTFAPGGTGGEYVGIRCKDSQTEYDIIYKNTFDGVDYGNFAEGMNRDIPGQDLRGLEFQCNINNGNEVDFIVAKKDPLDHPQIRTFQGTQETEAGNTFSSGPQLDTEGHFKNEGTQVVDYFYHTNPPVYYTQNYVVPIYVVGENNCPSNYGGGSGGDPKGLVLTPEQKTQSEMDYATNLSDYNNVKALYNNLKDGGNTLALQNEIEMSWPQDMWELRAELLGKSPHLSKEVLMTMADKTDVLPESVMFEILSANPDELRKEDLISYLENKEQPLPEYMISILKQLAGGITYKTILLQDMARYNAAKTVAAYDLIRSSLNETETDYQYLRNWLDNLDNMNADMQIVETFLAESDYSSTQAMLDMIPSLYELQGNALEEYNDFKAFTEMRMNWMQEGRNIFELSDTEIAELVDYADNGKGKASAMAKGILEFAYGHYYCNCLPLGNGTSSKSTPLQSLLKEQDHGLVIEATPNPAETWVTFDYSLPVYASEAVLLLTDMKGNSVAQFILESKQGQQILDVRDVEKGVYLYTLTVGSNSKSGKLIIE